MLFARPSRNASLAPRIGDEVLPTPAEEWAETTFSSIKASVDRNAIVLAQSASGASTPGPHVPGAYPQERSLDYSVINSGYIRVQQQVKDAVIGASAAATRYLPGSLASYFPEPRTESSEATSRDEMIKPGRSASPLNDKPLDQEVAVNLPKSEADSRNVNDIGTSYLTPHTNPSPHDSIARSNISTKTLNGSPVTTPSRYSSQLSLTHPGIENGVLYSGSETADTTHRGSETGEDHEGLENGSTFPDTLQEERHNPKDDIVTPASIPEDTSSKETKPKTTAEGPYPPFLGPVDDGNRLIGSSTMTPKVGESREALDNQALEEFHGIKSPTLNTQGRTHPLSGPGAKWRGVPLYESYQKALDDNSDRQLNLGTGKDNISATKPACEESKTQEVKRGIEGIKNHVVDRTKNHENSSQARQRTSSIGINDNRHEERERGHRRSASESTPGRPTPGAEKTKNMLAASRSGKRVSWIDKFKGEMKVMSGKLSNDGEKIEQGKRMMGKIV
ncbi:hypothetical protein DXG01_008538 [Tephrocybe rancida]|nr:hypothetical protein DXG01_008538 [Tephrocybe rancida]